MDLLEDILYYENESMMQTLLTLGLITAIVLTILICAVIVPASKEGKYTGETLIVNGSENTELTNQIMGGGMHPGGGG